MSPKDVRHKIEISFKDLEPAELPKHREELGIHGIERYLCVNFRSALHALKNSSVRGRVKLVVNQVFLAGVRGNRGEEIV